MKYRRTSVFHPVQIPFGLTIWSLWFATMYGSHAVAAHGNCHGHRMI
jgi:hypothetical protein